MLRNTIRILCFVFLILSILGCKKNSSEPYADVDDPALRQLLMTPAAQRYYWYEDEKMFFNWDTTMYVVDIKGDADQLDDALEAIEQKRPYHRLEYDPSIARLGFGQSHIDALLPKLGDGLELLARYPASRLVSQSHGLFFITDEISVKFKVEMNASESTAFAEKHQLEYIETMPHGTHLFRSKNRMRTLAIANFIHENEQIVEWSSPNFLMVFSLGGVGATAPH